MASKLLERSSMFSRGLWRLVMSEKLFFRNVARPLAFVAYSVYAEAVKQKRPEPNCSRNGQSHGRTRFERQEPSRRCSGAKRRTQGREGTGCGPDTRKTQRDSRFCGTISMES